MSWMLVLLGVVIVCVIITINSGGDEEYVSDRELRETFLKEYINSNCCVWVKIKSLPKSFKIGNVYFNQCHHNKYHQIFLSYVIVDGKVYDNGGLSIDFECNRICGIDKEYNRIRGIDKEYNFSCNTTNSDLTIYILDNLDKVEEIKNND